MIPTEMKKSAPGMAAILAIWAYGVAVISAMMNAPAPITGGRIIHPVEAAASIAAAMWGGNPVRIMSGIVVGPSTTVLATWLPLIVPNSALETTAACAGPPAIRPKR